MELSITAERLNNLKIKVANEMKRRSAVEHSASLFVYGGVAWEFENPPNSGGTVTDEHIQKIIDPLLEINDFLYDNSFRSGKNGLEIGLQQAEKFVETMAAIPANSEDSGCRGNCTGLCTLSCTSQCTGCDGCTGGCSTTCSKACANGCGGSCGGCSDGCYSGCTHTCGSGCTTSLKY